VSCWPVHKEFAGNLNIEGIFESDSTTVTNSSEFCGRSRLHSHRTAFVSSTQWGRFSQSHSSGSWLWFYYSASA